MDDKTGQKTGSSTPTKISDTVASDEVKPEVKKKTTAENTVVAEAIDQNNQGSSAELDKQQSSDRNLYPTSFNKEERIISTADDTVKTEAIGSNNQGSREGLVATAVPDVSEVFPTSITAQALPGDTPQPASNDYNIGIALYTKGNGNKANVITVVDGPGIKNICSQMNQMSGMNVSTAAAVPLLDVIGNGSVNQAGDMLNKLSSNPAGYIENIDTGQIADDTSNLIGQSIDKMKDSPIQELGKLTRQNAFKGLEGNNNKVANIMKDVQKPVNADLSFIGEPKKLKFSSFGLKKKGGKSRTAKRRASTKHSSSSRRRSGKIKRKSRRLRRRQRQTKHRS